MGNHETLLEQTALWEEYAQREVENSRRDWVRDVYRAAMDWLTHVSATFPNYTLHDETHVLNVMNAMASVLGGCIGKLTVGELELLILAASLHDVGMVYDDASKQRAAGDERKCRRFLLDNQPELVGCPWDEWPSELQQRYLRFLHPFRVAEVLNGDAWRPLFDAPPHGVAPEHVIVAVCEAHGEDVTRVKDDENLSYLPAPYDADPRFCAMLLRLSDLLDFDDTRAPSVLFRFAAGSEKSVEEWKKHRASGGFAYKDMPSDKELNYTARCTEPGVYHTVLEFLTWIDDELSKCEYLKRYCSADWQRSFPFPRRVSRKGVACVGFSSEEFKLTMDQEQILRLLTGENLYSGNDAFVRELLQNAIDATLLREQMDPSFHAEEARIDLREWCDRDGTLWFRIDDQGTGMTAGMLKRYFLKVGNSYYTSRELTQDLRRHSAAAEYRGISRFGIGFLSCFLCGVSAEVSTLYFDEQKSRADCEAGAGDRYGYGLRMEITGLSGYYALRSQAERHSVKRDLPAPEAADGCAVPRLEYDGYRSVAGTSIVVKLDAGKLGMINLKEAAEGWLCGARVPVYYNGERIGRTYAEIMAEAHRLAGKTVYELSEEQKAEFDEAFPKAAGNYPKIVAEINLLNQGRYHTLSGLSGVIVKYDARFDTVPEWSVKDQRYTLTVSRFHGTSLVLKVKNKDKSEITSWEDLQERYAKKDLIALETCFSNLSACPTSVEQLGEVWHPFSREENVHNLWVSYVYYREIRHFLDLFIPLLSSLTELVRSERFYGIVCSFQGIYCGNLATTSVFAGNPKDYMHFTFGYNDALFFLEQGLQPTVNLARTEILELPLQALASICSILSHPAIKCNLNLYSQFISNRFALAEWRRFRESEAGQHILRTQEARISNIMGTLRKPINIHEKKTEAGIYNLDSTLATYIEQFAVVKVLYRYITAVFQDDYDLTIDYENGQTIGFTEKRERESNYDLFPPMLFCKAANAPSRKYLCCGSAYYRRGITADHPFAAWLIQNAPKLNAFYSRQFTQIVNDLCEYNADAIIETVNAFREQLTKLTDRHGIDLASFPVLTEDDFWSPKDD